MIKEFAQTKDMNSYKIGIVCSVTTNKMKVIIILYKEHCTFLNDFKKNCSILFFLHFFDIFNYNVNLLHCGNSFEDIV